MRVRFLFLSVALLVNAQGIVRAGGVSGDYLSPFAITSPWNVRPVAPVFGSYEIPKSDYFPSISEGKYSSGVFLAQRSDKPAEIFSLPGKPGVWDPDAEVYRTSIVIPHWPASVIPAAGNDGHADIVDPETGRIHSFYRLTKTEGQWRAQQYAWTDLNGRGWGNPAHYFQGARAAGVPTTGGLIRKHEINDGTSHYRHALAMSMTFNAMSADPVYVYPATSGDRDAAKTNFGAIPEGALMMLPPSFRSEAIANSDLRKVVETLKIYGAYVVDRNHGTPFGIYVEIGSGFQLHRGGWDKQVARDLDLIRASLRQVVSVAGWVDGNGDAMTMETNLNRLSMRGPWRMERGSVAGAFDTWAQAVLFPPAGERIEMVNRSGRSITTVTWAKPQAGERYRLTATGKGGAALRLRLYGAGGALQADSGELADGESSLITWPAGAVAVVLHTYSGTSGESSQIGGSLVAVE